MPNRLRLWRFAFLCLRAHLSAAVGKPVSIPGNEKFPPEIIFSATKPLSQGHGILLILDHRSKTFLHFKH